MTAWLECDVCGAAFGGSHYHCGRCFDPEPTSMMGHGVRFDDGTFGLTCDVANLGKTYFSRRRVVASSQIRPPVKGSSC